MKHKILFALPMLVLAACSRDDLIEVNRSADEISFEVVSDNATRAAALYCNNNKPERFAVWAKATGNVNYILADTIAYSGGAWTDINGTRYWPDGNVDFYANVNAGDKFAWNDGVPTIDGFIVADAAAGQKDVLYAVKTGQSKSNSPVTLNFRHAMSQIVFNAKNTNAKLHVEISGVSVCNVKGKGTFTYPSASTDGNVVDHTGAGTYPASGVGSWSTASDAVDADYSVTFDGVVAGASATALTSTPVDGNNAKALLLMPQATEKWVPVAGQKAEDATGSYLMVKALIHNVAGESFDASNDVMLWGDTVEGAAVGKDIAIPVAFDWKPGKKYIYTFVFGNGGGGYDPEDPDPVLVPITFDVTVDDFVAADAVEVEAETVGASTSTPVPPTE